MKAIYERELKSYLTNITGYLFGAFILLFAGIFVMIFNLRAGYANFEYVLKNMEFILMIGIPILTMRVVAEEHHQKTDQLLYSLPLSMVKVVMGKYFAMLTVIAVPVGIMCTYPLMISLFGKVSLKTAYGAMIGFFFLAAALAAIGMFISSVTENQAVAAGLCFAVMLVLFFLSDLSNYVSKTTTGSVAAIAVLILAMVFLIRLLTKNATAALLFGVVCEGMLLGAYSFWPDKFEGVFPSVIEKLSVFERYYVFTDGVFDLTGIVYFLSIIGVFLFLSVQSLEKRRWS